MIRFVNLPADRGIEAVGENFAGFNVETSCTSPVLRTIVISDSSTVVETILRKGKAEDERDDETSQSHGGPTNNDPKGERATFPPGLRARVYGTTVRIYVWRVRAEPADPYVFIEARVGGSGCLHGGHTATMIALDLTERL